jgi:arginine decarboxylase
VFFGEYTLRSDVSVSVGALGSLLDHTGPIAEGERNAARIFGADHLFFVTNGTSTSNKIVWHYVVAPGDVVIVDRNCHKSVLHAITMTGAIPVFLTPTRNHYGIIGAIPLEEFRWESIEAKIRAHPLIGPDWKDKGKPRILTLTQSTYDGIVYNVETIKTQLDGRVDTLHFDEAWLPHAAFHEFYRDMHAIGGRSARPRNRESMIFSTQSTHKLLAGLSQASQILIEDSETERLDRFMFNEAFLMHTSTSPQYAIIASCDVAAAMMEPPGGTALVEESITEALDFRRAMRKVDEEFGADENGGWWFKVWGPEHLAADGIGTREDWMLKPGDAWHGFDRVAPGFNMLDPIKATVITPGLNLDGTFADPGIPAAVVTKYLAEHGIIVEKTGLYSFFIMFTIGITKGRWNTMVTELQQFKDDYDHNQPLWRVMPEFIRAFPQYEKMGLRALCTAVHEMYRESDIARLTTEMYLSEMEPVMKPADAYSQMAHSAVDRVPIDELEGRVTSVLLTPYPPGIPLLIPGERVNRTIVRYLQFAREMNARYPGFGTDIHGLVKEEVGGRTEYFLDCVRP